MTGTTSDYWDGYRDGADDARRQSDERLDVLMVQGYSTRYIAGYEAGVLAAIDEAAS